MTIPKPKNFFNSLKIGKMRMMTDKERKEMKEMMKDKKFKKKEKKEEN